MQILFIPGLNCTGELFAPQVAALGGTHECHIADHGVADDMKAIAASVLAQAPERFALVGLSMGGYVAYEILRQAPQRVEMRALLDTRAQPDSEEDAERRAGPPRRRAADDRSSGKDWCIRRACRMPRSRRKRGAWCAIRDRSASSASRPRF